LPEHFGMADSRSIAGSERLKIGWRHYYYCKQDSDSSSEIVGGIGIEDTAVGSIAVGVGAAVPAEGSKAQEGGVCCGKRIGPVGLRMRYGGLSVAVKAVFDGSVVL